MPLHITSTTKSVKLIRPVSKAELMSIIKTELERQGPDANLNHIDTSEITSMSELFFDLDIRNIKIDQWDVSNVDNMFQMFRNCRNFNCDLSKWHTSKVISMAYMFYGCSEFESDLSCWDTSKVEHIFDMFTKCPKMTFQLRPNLYNNSPV